MFCHNCGTQLPDDAKFCSKCGQPLQSLSASALTGTWLGYGYTCRGAEPPEQIKIENRGNTLTATKITGDDCIKAGQVTWEGTMRGNNFPVRVHVGFPGTRGEFINGIANVVDLNLITVSTAEWTVTFRRVRDY